METIAKALVRLFGIEPKDEITSAFTAEEVQHIVAESHREGLIEEEQHGLVGAALEFSDKDAIDVAVPLDSLVTLPLTATPDDVERLVAKRGFSRYPLVDASGALSGYLHLKDVLYADDIERALPVPVKRVRRLATVQPQDEVEEVLATMQRTGAHLARVVDEQGADLGVVFLEDVLEEPRRRGHRRLPALTRRHTVEGGGIPVLPRSEPRVRTRRNRGSHVRNLVHTVRNRGSQWGQTPLVPARAAHTGHMLKGDRCPRRPCRVWWLAPPGRIRTCAPASGGRCSIPLSYGGQHAPFGGAPGEVSSLVWETWKPVEVWCSSATTPSLFGASSGSTSSSMATTSRRSRTAGRSWIGSVAPAHLCPASSSSTHRWSPATAGGPSRRSAATRVCAASRVMVTASVQQHDRVQAEAAGLDAFVPKPFDPEYLVELVEGFMGDGRGTGARSRSATAARTPPRPEPAAPSVRGRRLRGRPRVVDLLRPRLARVTPEELSLAIRTALTEAVDAGALTATVPAEVRVERPKNRDHGDWSTNVALQLAKGAGMPPRDAGGHPRRAPRQVPGVKAVDIAGPGFLNITLDAASAGELAPRHRRGRGGLRPQRLRGGSRHQPRVHLRQPDRAPAPRPHPLGRGRRRHAPPAQGPRAPTVTAEYYINDAGAQMDRFGRSVLARAQGKPTPEGGYPGDYVHDLAKAVARARPDLLELPEDEAIGVARELGYAAQLADIKETLDDFGVHFDVWFSERTLHDGGAVETAVERLREQGHVFDADGAIWLRTTDFGDDKDRVLVRANGEPTYFAADAAYYLDKRDRGFDELIYLLGADHHGYINRLKAIAACAGDDPERNIEVLIGQLVNLKAASRSAEQARRQHHRPARPHRRWIGIDAAATPWRATPPTPRSPRPRPAAQADQRQPGVLRAVRPRPHRERRGNAAEDGCTARTASTRAARPRDARPTCSPPSASSRASSPGRRAARAAPGRALPRGARRPVPQVVRHLPGAPATPTRRSPTCTARACGSTTRPARCSPTASTCSASRARADVERRHDAPHEAGALHAEGYGGPPAAAERRHGALPQLWPLTVRARRRRLTVGGVDVRDLAAEYGTAGIRPRRGRLPRARPGLPRRSPRRSPRSGGRRRLLRRQGVPVHRRRPLGRRGGPAPRRLHRRRARRRAARRLPGRADRLHGNNKSVAEIQRALDDGVGRIVVDSSRRSSASPPSPPSSASRPGDDPGDRRRRGAHPRVHRDRARGPEVRLLARGGDAADAVRAGPRRRARAARAALATSARRSSTPSGFEVAARRLIGCTPRSPRARRRAARDRPRRRLRHRLHHRAHPAEPEGARRADGRDRRAASAARRRPGTPCPRISIEPGPRDRRARAPSRSTRSAPSRTSSSATGTQRAYVSSTAA